MVLRLGLLNGQNRYDESGQPAFGSMQAWDSVLKRMTVRSAHRKKSKLLAKTVTPRRTFRTYEAPQPYKE